MSKLRVEDKKVSDLIPDSQNVNVHSQRGRGIVEHSVRRYGIGRGIVAAGKGTDTPQIIGGHLTTEIVGSLDMDDVIFVHTNGEKLVVTVRDDIAPNSVEAIALGLIDNESQKQSYNPDLDILAAVMADPAMQALKDEDKILAGIVEGMGLKGETIDAEPQTDRAAELLEKWQVKAGDLWQIGEHRLICGDCTDAVTVSRLLSGVTVALVHADPPYGMGFEIDGIANDNLYREDLDTFQMAWWKACRPLIANNASVYIWGWEDSLFSFYLLLRDNKTDRITKRNYIIWNKGSGEGMRQESLRRFAPVTEHCLFFMLGEQGFNNNADNYWHGWDNVKDYLKGEADKVGLTPSKLQEICGVGMYSHWFTESQWTFITEEHYKKLQTAFKKDYDAFKKDYDAFKKDYDELKKDYDELKKDYDELKKDYDELKKDFYATRAYFDNTHDNMTDVWDFGRVTGEERMGHATPKPVAMMERVIKSSSPIGAAVFVPFLGTAPEMVAAENTGRVVYGIDLEPSYCAVTLERMATAFPELEIKRLE